MNGCLREAGIPFSTLWSKDFKNLLLKDGLRQWIKDKVVVYDASMYTNLFPEMLGSPSGHWAAPHWLDGDLLSQPSLSHINRNENQPDLLRWFEVNIEGCDRS